MGVTRAGTTPGFVHLHTHTEYSLLDGMTRVGQVLEMAHRDGQPAAAITDHGNLFGALKFHAAARKAGVKPILGCEAYVSPGRHRDKNPDRDNQHLVLLARNETGYRNLIRLSSIAHLDGYYFRPRFDFETLASHHEGLIALSACPKGALPREILKDDGDPVGVARQYLDVFGEGNYFLEVMDHRPADGGGEAGTRLGDLERRIGAGLLEVHGKTGIPLVATNDSHYAEPEDADAHDLRLCISTNRTFRDPKRLRFDSNEFHFKSAARMVERFAEFPDACSNTLRIAEKIEDYDVVGGPSLLPDFPVPEGRALEEHFEAAARAGLERRLESPERHGRRPDRSAYDERLAEELAVIAKTGYSAYFLIVQDFVRFARGREIPVGPGRGSAAGSLVGYALGITDIDPLAHGLLFERFLNPERVSPPDIDVDFCELRREEVLAYVADKYGSDRVAQILTMNTMQARLVVRDVGRMLELKPTQVDRLAKLIPFGASLDEAVEQVGRLREAQRDPAVARLFALARRLEGLPRSVGTHAAGVVVAPRPLQEILPLYREVEAPSGAAKANGATSDSGVVRWRTQYDMKDCEAVGLFKMDFLGLRSLTQIADCARRIVDDEAAAKTPDQSEALDHIRAGRFEKVPPDADAFRLFARADTHGIFQFESSGMRDLLSSYAPESLDDLAALNALFRPGPLNSGMTAEFVRAKSGPDGLSKKLDPRVRRLFPETRGLIVYQEQVMLAARELAGYSLGQADILRKAMGKKDPRVMKREQTRFVEGAAANGLDRTVAQETFRQIAEFAGYGFNRSHAVGYALVAYVGGWLKHHFPLHFTASLLTAQHRASDRDERIARTRAEAEKAKIRILPPDAERSGAAACVEGDAVRYGLGAVKHVGERAAQAIEEARERIGPFASLGQLLEEVEGGILNRGSLEALTGAGAFDFLGVERSRIVAGIPTALAVANRARARREHGALALFGDADTAPVDRFPEAPPWTDAERLEHERGALGFYWSGHPGKELRRAFPAASSGIRAVRRGADRRAVTVVGLVRSLEKRMTRRGQRMGKFRVEDDTGAISVVAFSEAWRDAPELELEPAVLVRGALRVRSGEDGSGGRGAPAEIVATEIRLAPEVFWRGARGIEVAVERPDAVAVPLRNLVERRRGQAPMDLRILADGVESVLRTAVAVAPSATLVAELETLLGPGAVRVDGRPVPSFARSPVAENPAGQRSQPSAAPPPRLH